jgi:peroxiredoxin Q/BCP
MSVEIGDKAPNFTLPTDGGGKVSLKDFKGKPVVLYFYPKDDTSGCTAEACAFRDQLPDFSKLKTAVIGVSRDSAASHDKFKTKYLPSRSRPTKTARYARPMGFGRRRACMAANIWVSSAPPS